MREFVTKDRFLACLIFLSIQTMALGAKGFSDQSPNILVILIDDLGYYDLGCYGSEIYQTPNIDNLLQESYSFKNAYANYPRCLYSLMTSTYPVNEFNIDLSITSSENNFIKRFDKAGYDSYYVGKWHLREDKNQPTGYGFDDSYAANGAGGVASHFYPFNTRKLIAPIGEVPPVENVQQDGKEGDYLVDLLANEMIRFISTKREKPFFGMLLLMLSIRQLKPSKKTLQEMLIRFKVMTMVILQNLYVTSQMIEKMNRWNTKYLINTN